MNGGASDSWVMGRFLGPGAGRPCGKRRSGLGALVVSHRKENATHADPAIINLKRKTAEPEGGREVGGGWGGRGAGATKGRSRTTLMRASMRVYSVI